jgi:hypothetical protein
MNDIIRPLTPCGMVGWDAHNQLWLWKNREIGGREGTIIADVRGKICPVCRHGWEITAESLGDQHYWTGRAEWAHESCFIRFLALQDQDFWRSALIEAQFIFGQLDNPKMLGEGGSGLQEIPNEYWGPKDPWGAGQPWYRVRLLKKLEDGYTNGPFGRTLKLGSRKRVYVLEVEPGEGPYDRALAEKLFASEKVTKEIRSDGIMVHAWGQDKAQEYLKHFAEILGVTEMRRKAAEALSSRR